MTDAAPQQVLLPGLLAAAGLAGREGPAAAGSYGRPALPGVPGLAGNGFQEQLQKLLGAGSADAAGADTAEAGRPDGLPLPATLTMPTAPPDAAKVRAPDTLPSGGKALPTSGNLLPSAQQLLRELAAPLPQTQAADAAAETELLTLPQRQAPAAEPRATGLAAAGHCPPSG